jgi:hypothetical protein
MIYTAKNEIEVTLCLCEDGRYAQVPFTVDATRPVLGQLARHDCLAVSVFLLDWVEITWRDTVATLGLVEGDLVDVLSLHAVVNTDDELANELANELARLGVDDVSVSA